MYIRNSYRQQKWLNFSSLCFPVVDLSTYFLSRWMNLMYYTMIVLLLMATQTNVQCNRLSHKNLLRYIHKPFLFYVCKRYAFAYILNGWVAFSRILCASECVCIGCFGVLSDAALFHSLFLPLSPCRYVFILLIVCPMFDAAVCLWFLYYPFLVTINESIPFVWVCTIFCMYFKFFFSVGKFFSAPNKSTTVYVMAFEFMIDLLAMPKAKWKLLIIRTDRLEIAIAVVFYE